MSRARSLTANSIATAGTLLHNQMGRPLKHPLIPCVFIRSLSTSTNPEYFLPPGSTSCCNTVRARCKGYVAACASLKRAAEGRVAIEHNVLNQVNSLQEGAIMPHEERHPYPPEVAEHARDIAVEISPVFWSFAMSFSVLYPPSMMPFIGITRTRLV